MHDEAVLHSSWPEMTLAHSLCVIDVSMASDISPDLEDLYPHLHLLLIVVEANIELNATVKSCLSSCSRQ